MRFFEKKDKRNVLEKERDAYVELMSTRREDAEQYPKDVVIVSRMTDAVVKDRKEESKIVDYIIRGLGAAVPIVTTVLIVWGNSRTTDRVLAFEETDVVSSKAKSFNLPWNSGK